MTDIIAKIRKSDGQLVRVHEDGREEVMPKQPMRPMTEEEIQAAALSDPDAMPLAYEGAGGLRKVSRSKAIRRALGLTQEEFASRYHIPLGTLRDWEQGRAEPDATARAYLKVIAVNPSSVSQALEASPL